MGCQSQTINPPSGPVPPWSLPGWRYASPRGGGRLRKCRRVPWLFLGLALGLLAFEAGCATPRRAFKPEQDPSTYNDAAFVHFLATVPTVTVGEGARAVLLLVGPTEQWPTTADQISELTRRGAFRTRWKLDPEDTLDRGTLAYMLRAICELPRGVNERVIGRIGVGDRRFALATCVHHALLPHGQTRDPVTGGELISAVTKAEELVDRRSNDS